VSPEDYANALAGVGVTPEVVQLLTYLFTTVLDGRNGHLGDGFQRALDRAPRDFAEYAADTAATGVWGGCPSSRPRRDVMLREPLRLRQEERTSLLQRARVAIEEDARVGAVWLQGFCARGDTDELSDLDLTVVVCDEVVNAVAGSPSRPTDYRRVLDSPRGRWVAQVAGTPLLLLEAPQNAPAGGAFLTSFIAGVAGPQQVDWEWLPQSSARRPRESLLLFDRTGIPLESEPPEVAESGLSPDRTPFEVAAHAVPWFWATLMWNAKHAARSPRDTHMPMLRQTVGAVGDVEQFLDPDKRAPAGEAVLEHPEDPLGILRDLSNRMERLMSRPSALFADFPSDLAPQARQFLRLAEEVMHRNA
jgi:hypothetical protein